MYQLQTTEIPGRAFAKVSADLIVELPTSHYNNNILVMVDHLTGWPIQRPYSIRGYLQETCT